MNEMSIDLETYSDVDISKCGAYKYAESDDFEILLFGVSIDGGEVQVFDLACGDAIPDDILAALSDDTVTKWAFMYFVKCFSQKSERKIPNLRNGIFPYISRKHFHMIMVQSVA